MKRITVMFKTKTGDTSYKEIDTPGSVFTAVKLLIDTHFNMTYVAHCFTQFEASEVTK